MEALELVAFYEEAEQAPSVRMRLLQTRDALARFGVRLTVRPDLSRQKWYYGLRRGAPLKTWFRWRRLARTAIREAAVSGAWILNHRLCRFSPFVAALYSEARRRRVPIVFDIDDAVYLRDKWASRGRRLAAALLEPNMSPFIFRRSTCVLAATNAIADRARLWNRRVRIIHTPVDTERFCPARNRVPPGNADKLVLGYAGNVFSHADDLRCILPVLDDLSRRLPSVTFRLAYTGNSAVLEEFRTRLTGRITLDFLEQIPYEDMPAFYNSLDFNLVPLLDEPFNHARCSTKLTEAMACGVPCVASPVGFHCEAVDPGVNGFLAEATPEWIECITQTVRHPDRWAAMGRAARRKVQTHYAIEAVCRKEAEFLLELAESRRRAGTQ
ncbi:MAG: glycosyltransferase family 4 protein [Kiritimatiellaeota bacterium]|nr:glycosyltransferase family 4 protein [Kiritimatiellota bacterium]